MDALAQIPLPIPNVQEMRLQNFIVGQNLQLLQALLQVSNSNDWCLYLWGGEGCGKTHLLQGVCVEAQERGDNVVYVSLPEVLDLSPDVLNHLEDYDLILLDDIQVVGEHPQWQEAIFHLYNKIHGKGHKLIISANCAPDKINVQLADLKSRLSAATIYHCHELSEEDKIKVMQQRANDVGLDLSKELMDYLLKRWPRNISALLNALNTLDEASMREKRKLTIPFVKQILELK